MLKNIGLPQNIDMSTVPVNVAWRGLLKTPSDYKHPGLAIPLTKGLFKIVANTVGYPLGLDVESVGAMSIPFSATIINWLSWMVSIWNRWWGLAS